MKKKFTMTMSLLLVAAILSAGCGAATSPTAPAATPATSVAPTEATPAPSALAGKTLKVGCSSTFVPFESVSMDASGKKTYVGMSIELVETIGANLGFTVEFQDMPFKSLIGAIQAGQIDMNLGGMMPTEERKQAIDFGEIYFYPRSAIVFKAGAGYTDLESLKGKTIAYSFGTNYQKIAETVPEMTGIGIQGSPACIEEVKVGRADACIIDGAGATEFLKQNEGLELSLLEKSEDCFAIGFPKESPYYDEINAELKKMMENGELDAIVAKYLSEEFILD